MSIDRYIKQKFVGAGGMASVFYAWDSSLERDVAIKKMSEQFQEDPEVRDLFINEAKKMASVRHPNVVQVYDVIEVDGAPTIIMEFMDGQSLATLLSADPCPEEQVLKTLRQVVDGLQAIHDAALVHRDVKPENILQTRTGEYKITDFGVAMSGSEEALPFVTSKYAAPEALLAPENISAASDLYSVGVIGYEMILGHRRFVDAVKEAFEFETRIAMPAITDSTQVFWQQWLASDVDFPPLNEVDPNISPEVAALFSRLTSKNKSDRLVNAREVIKRIDEILEKKGTREAEPTVYTPPKGVKTPKEIKPSGGKWPLWKKALAGIGALLVLAVVALLLLPTGPPTYYFDVETDPPGASVSLNGEPLAGVTPLRVTATWGDQLNLALAGRDDIAVTLADNLPELSVTDESYKLTVGWALAINNSAEAAAFLEGALADYGEIDASLTSGVAADQIGIDMPIVFQLQSPGAGFLTMLHLGADDKLTQVYPDASGDTHDFLPGMPVTVGPELNLVALPPTGTEWFVFIVSANRLSAPQFDGALAGAPFPVYSISGPGSGGQQYLLWLAEALQGQAVGSQLLKVQVVR